MGVSDLPDEMQAIQVVEYNKPYEIRTVPVPKNLGPYDLLLKTAIGSYCHTDSMVQSGVFGTSLPCTASHEGAGTVVAVGSSVNDFKEGDRVMAGLLRNACGKCGDCLGPENYRQYCRNSDGYIGVTTQGTFAEYVLVDARWAAKLPERVSFGTAAPLACAGCTVFRGVILPELKAGEWIALVGSGGGLGHLGIQFAKALGLMVVGVDARDEGLALSKEAGADVVVDARKGKDEVVKEVHKVTNGEGVHAAVNLSEAKDAAATACAITKMHGTMVQIAQPTEVCIPFAEYIFRDIRVRGSLICSREEAKRMLDIVAEHRISVKTNPFNGLKEITKLTDLVHGGKMAGKGIIIVDPEQIEKEKQSGLEMV
ncbi:hypothetical protein H2201_005019 [Coniosporium apollinis]|uniref:Enoyl reductase (ER) domain-containing protein n=1 Tax=Coniosporium apollinis TaxID=61459 RepID=A0ABQ9NSA6_9PEZI|nr:hypothetical protein H2201_005019 [Coniosporium apollinis]